jgi:hypothetical protein
VPVSTVTEAADSALATHEVLDDAAHQQIAATEDEDYKWLTDLLEGLSQRVSSLEQTQTTKFESLLVAFQESREQSKTLIEAQTQMIETLTANLTALSESALLRSNLSSLETSSQAAPEAETETATVTEIVPENNAPTPEQSAEGAPKKRYRRI